MTQTAPTAPARIWRKDGVIGLWGRMIHRDPSAYDAWLEERDMTMITAALLRLNERQLNRIGMSRSTLVIDVEDLALRAARDRQIAEDVLSIVEKDAEKERMEKEGSARHAIAAA
ncbi:MAG: hypothetical protein P3W94_009890 [Paracoccus sp. (in: a-proteobacteria)]|nr:hypothetical protein [Paracoccus sp. (in: a-proteobacteria)]